jgi:glycosyltransferase involved in cell wall biosynthesis
MVSEIDIVCGNNYKLSHSALEHRHHMTTPRLSICVPTYKRANLLRETLAHLHEVCDDTIEIVISDNCSPDGTQDVVDSFSRQFRHFRAVRQRENRGAMRNQAAVLALASGQYVYILHDDDRIHMSGIETAVSILQERPDIVAVYGGYEEWIPSTGRRNPLRWVEQRTDFAQGDKLGVVNRFTLLWLPVSRTDIVRRFCTFERRSFGMCELIGSLLEHGGISVIPDLFYMHAHTEPRTEYELTENWYHDAYRADFECFMGRCGPFDHAELARFISTRTTVAYEQGMRFAAIKGDFLCERHFALRARGYGLLPEPKVRSWEAKALVGMVAERLVSKVEAIPEISEIVFEASPRLLPLRKQLATVAPQYALVEISDDSPNQHQLKPHQFLVTYRYGSFESGAPVECEPTLSAAVEDLIATCRITDQPLAFDAAGVVASASAPAPPLQLASIAKPASPAAAAPSGLEYNAVSDSTKRVGRNDPCPCGSGKKYKACHGRLS